MDIRPIKGNTWVLEGMEWIPFYKLDERRCILLDTGLNDQREELEEALQREGLTPVGVICSHAHIDHMGNVAYLKEKYGTKLAMSLGEAGHQMSYLGLNITNYLMSPEDVVASPPLHGTPCLADRIILPTEDRITFCGAAFDIIHTPGHTVDHICVGTPDDVLYVGDAMMTGRTLHYAKFPYALSMEVYLDSMVKLREAKAACYVVAHKGVYEDIRPFIDLELQFLRERMEELAGLLELVAAEGADAFYTGPVARKMVEQINQRGGCFTLEDLSRYQPKYRTPVKTTYRGLEVAAFAPPSGGCAGVEMLNILEHSDLAAMGHNTAASIHAIAEAMKLGFADRSVALGDPDFVQVDVERLTSKAHAAERYALSSPETAGEYAPAEGIEAKEYPGNTSHFAVMDRFGNAVSQTQTVRDWFGCGIVVDGCGFVLNNAMSDFSAKPGALTSQGLTYGSANSIQGGKTPLSSMAPSMVFKDGRPYLAIGAAGGPRIITGTLQGIVNAVDFGMLPEQLVRQPYLNCLTREQGLELEFGISEDTIRLLEQKGHRPVRVPVDQAMSTMLNSVMYVDGEYHAAGTQRVDGCGGALLSDGHMVLDGISQED